MMHFIRVNGEGESLLYINVDKICALRACSNKTQIWFSGLEDDYFSCKESLEEILQKIGKMPPVDVAN